MDGAFKFQRETNMAKTKTEYLQEIARDYREAGEKWPATCKEIAAWAIREGLWKPYSKNLISQCASEIASAMREEHFTDPQGRSVRAKRPYRQATIVEGVEEQLYLWVDMRQADENQAQMAFQYGRKMIMDDCLQLKIGVESYNENNFHGASIEMSFDFNEDMEEMDQPTEYPGLKV
jgi:hypothetical protein